MQLTSGSVFWSTYVLLVRRPSSQADKSWGVLWQLSPIRHWAVVFLLCPYSADKRPNSGVCQPTVLVVTSCRFSFSTHWLNYCIFCSGPLDMVKHTSQCVGGMHTLPVWAVAMSQPCFYSFRAFGALYLPPCRLADRHGMTVVVVQMKCWMTFFCSSNCSTLRKLQSETCVSRQQAF